MATKKQKRERGEQKHKKFMAEVRKTGLEAQRKDRERRARNERRAWQEQHDKKHNWKKRIKECPLCQDELVALKKLDNEHTDHNTNTIIDSKEGISLKRVDATSENTIKESI